MVVGVRFGGFGLLGFRGYPGAWRVKAVLNEDWALGLGLRIFWAFRVRFRLVSLACIGMGLNFITLSLGPVFCILYKGLYSNFRPNKLFRYVDPGVLAGPWDLTMKVPYLELQVHLCLNCPT